MSILIYGICVMVGMGAFFGFVLAFVNKKFVSDINPLIELVDEALPKGQCGACGYAGCMAYAEAVATDPDVPPNLCIPGKAAVAMEVAELTGKMAEATEPAKAYLKCRGSAEHTKDKYAYKGVKDCVAANILLKGHKSCEYGCLGYGSCVKECHFDAMVMGKDGLPKIDEYKCTGCGACVKACPKQVLGLAPESAHVHVTCNSKDKGAVVRKICDVACIGCGICGKNCPHNAIEIVNNLAVVNHAICAEKCSESTCVAKCPTKAIS